jgi:hypothetical protein
LTLNGKTMTHEKSLGVKQRSAREKTTLPLSFIVPDMDKIPHIPQISVAL